jgi:D-alanyl-D-alanine dipeptidase
MPTERPSFKDRRHRAAIKLRASGCAALLLSPGPDLFYLTGYQVFASERLSCLVLLPDARATMICPELEAPRVAARAPDLERAVWSETDDPFALVARFAGEGSGDIAIADQMWAAFVLRLESALRGRRLRVASDITRDLRARKDGYEREALRAASEAADRAYAGALARPFAGRTEREIGDSLATLLRQEGHDEVGFTIVGSGPNGASPHHQTGDRKIREGDTVVLDFGGGRAGYRSDITRTVHVGASIDREQQRVHDVVRRAQEAGYAAARNGATAESVDAASRAVIDDAGYARQFIHRTGHGIGLEGHEHPYLVRGNRELLEPGMAFSIEPGVYLEGRFGVRIEDIAIIDDDGRVSPLNQADHAFAIVG